MIITKRSALFLDGTWNTGSDNTNVWRLRSLCVADADQAVYYSDGVGTKKGERIIGGMFGWGLDDEVLRAYKWLVETHVEGARLFIFGFSRGAFTARSLAGFISRCGLIQPGSPISLKHLYRRYQRGNTVRSIRELQKTDPATLSLEDRWLRKYSRPTPVYFQGVWDTVGALGVPFGHIPIISRSDYKFLEVDLHIDQTYAYHAMAIDEHRIAFAPTLWQRVTRVGVQAYPPRALADVEQRWFSGAHSDVGGGYDNDVLAQVPLRWIMGKAAKLGLRFRDLADIDGDIEHSGIHNSFTEMAWGFYAASKFWVPYYREIGRSSMNRGGAEIAPINETIDASVFERWRALGAYRPRNLVQWAAARNLKPDTINTGVFAKSGEPLANNGTDAQAPAD